jgi:hypothetical protein
MGARSGRLSTGYPSLVVSLQKGSALPDLSNFCCLLGRAGGSPAAANSPMQMRGGAFNKRPTCTHEARPFMVSCGSSDRMSGAFCILPMVMLL